MSLENLWLGEELFVLGSHKQLITASEGKEKLVCFSAFDGYSCFFGSTVASWLSHASFVRWGFEGMLQVQFRGKEYPVTIGNISISVDGIHVSEALSKKFVSHNVFGC